ncbi:hypothetical protein MGU_09352 [Metarhizium guizhouense ARSEF 977]|uniref:Uncharacterized protein n=1 Tax=Metarhizium guizhouense (strain ARSEF 977) TaxID=1276136 RepID=A0A0B4HV20_METGA|nr:hypothetical protein MGU_09352 [Metarhizium guizhouense ARSEF 977]
MTPFYPKKDDGLPEPVDIDVLLGHVYETLQSTPMSKPPCELSDEDAERRVLLAVKNMGNLQSALTERLDVFADMLMSRWIKQSQAKREALLKEAAPDLEEKQWLLPRYSLLRPQCYLLGRSQKGRRRLLLPWLNVEVLKTNPAVLFALLHYRTAYSPQHWAAFDSQQLDLSWASGYFNVDFSPKCVVMYGHKYGSLVDWDKHAAHRADILGFPRASLVLEAQAYLMEVLHNIVTKILEGVDNSQPPRIDKWRNLISNAAFRETGVVEFWSPYTNQAFSPPPQFNSKYLVSLAETRLHATEDHLWHLQCDAAYMRRYLKIMFPTGIFKSSDFYQGRVLVERIHVEVLSYHWWRCTAIECRHVDAARGRFRDSVYPGAALPIDYDRALGGLQLLLVNQIRLRIAYLQDLLPLVPGLQKHWSFEPYAQPHLPHIGTLRRKTPVNTQESLTNDRLDWCLVQLLANPCDSTAFDPATLFAMLQEHMRNNPSERNRLDEVTYQVLSDLATCHEMLMAVLFHRPQNTNGTACDFKTLKERHSCVLALSMRKNDEAEYSRDRQNIGRSLLKNFSPANAPAGPKTPAWLAKSQQLRADLETFWESIRRTLRKEFKDWDLSPAEADDLLEVISVNLSDQYRQDKQREDNEVLAAIHERNRPQPVTNFFNGAETCSTTATIIPRLEKTKTRGTPKPPLVDDETPDVQAETTAVVNVATIKVAKQSLDVFHLMFPDKDGAAKDVTWDRFVHAMADARFTARNNGGSHVSFKQRDGEGRIVFHRPHPVPKIDPVMLRVMAQRMAKRFGWRRELFVLRDDATQA